MAIPRQIRPTQNADMTANALGEQISQLAAKSRLCVTSGIHPTPTLVHERMPYNAPAAAPEDNSIAAPPITLVLRSGKQVQLKSYAVMGKSIWDFNSVPAKRIALSTVDVEASKTATEASGGEFPEIR